MFGPAAPDEGVRLPTRCVGALSGHEGAVLNVRFNGSGAYALSCGKDRTLRLWSVTRGALIKTYTGHGHEVRARGGCCFSAWHA
jgi:mitogen-activated protein kinase organizer 1